MQSAGLFHKCCWRSAGFQASNRAAAGVQFCNCDYDRDSAFGQSQPLKMTAPVMINGCDWLTEGCLSTVEDGGSDLPLIVLSPFFPGV